LSIRELDDDSEEPAINRLQKVNKNLYKHLLALEDPEELALRRQIEELDFNQK
jgi:hypothetical protein